MTQLEITLLVGFQAVVLVALFVFFYTRLENRIEQRVDSLEREAGDLKRRAERLGAQCVELSAQVSAIANAINASRAP